MIKNKNHKSITVLGAGAWGTAMAMVLAKKGHDVCLWALEKDVVGEINRKHQNSRYLKDVKLPESLVAEGDLLKAAENRDVIIIAIPSLYVLENIKRLLSVENIREGKSLIALLSKGFVETDKGIRLLVETCEDYLPGFYKNSLIYVSGPSHAEEVAQGKVTGLISASLSGINAIKIRELLSGENLMVFSSFDVVGVQICAAMKNVIAIAFGMFDALKELSEKFGDNTESLLLAAGLNELQILGKAMGASHPETFTSIAGVGDLDVTCRSIYGRNRRFGREIILKKLIEPYKNIDEIKAHLNQIGYLPEGLFAADLAHELIEKHHLKMPITQGVYQVLSRKQSPLKVVNGIISSLTRGANGESQKQSEIKL
ncbi:MAG: NAD(P)-dependent glycerol-3-phosphate dehydrogenase [Spirochaetales bacterium]|nr:NAD(P)-dependent glycerol-3-phosphate dehydrogenase [Spirochaetales bacterium]